MKRKNLRTFVFKASWRSTAKKFKVEARSENEAWIKACRSKEIAGCMDLGIVEMR